MISTIKNYFNNGYFRIKFIKFNKFFLRNAKIAKQNGIFLVEFNAFHDHHVIYSIFSYFFKKNYFCKTFSFYNNCLLTTPLVFNKINSLKWKIGNFFSLKHFAIYRSFGVDEIFKPEIDKNITKLANKYFSKNFNKIRSKKDLLNFKINNILLGDLLYDTYLKSRILPTININSEDFKKFFLDFLKLFFFWDSYFKEKKVIGIIASHSVYSYAIPLRLALSRKIPSFISNPKFLIKFSKKNFYGSIFGDYRNYKKDFNNLNKKKRTVGLLIAKEQIKKRFIGITGPEVNMEYADISSFTRNNNTRVLKDNDKFKVLISTHDFFDAVHYYGKGIFADFYEWINFLLETSKNTNFDWYIKNHPKYSGRFRKYQPFTDDIVSNMIRNYKNVTLLPNNTTNKQLIAEGIGAVLTVYGTVAAEFPYFNIPVINATKHNVHCNYYFSISPSSKKEYKKIIKNLDKIRVPKFSKKQIHEYYFMRHMIVDPNWLFENYSEMLDKIGGYHNLQSYYFYKFWINYCKKVTLKKIEEKIKIFIKSKQVRLTNNFYN